MSFREHLIRFYLKDKKIVDMHREDGNVILSHKHHQVTIPHATGQQTADLAAFFEPLKESAEFPEGGNTMNQEKIDACYALEDNTEALDCLKDVIRSSEEESPPRLVLLTQENCAPCEEEKVYHEKALKEGIIKEIDVDTKEGSDIADKNEIDNFPSLVLLDNENKIIYPSESESV